MVHGFMSMPCDNPSQTGLDEETTTLNDLFDRRRRSLFAVALQRLRVVEDAEDAVQETYLKSRKVAWASVQNPDAMLTTIHLNVIYDMLRRRKHSPVEEGRYEEAAEVVASPQADPEQTLLSKIRWKLVSRSIDALPPVCRKIFLMVKIDGLSHAEISDHTGMSRAAIEKNVVRAMQRLRQDLT